jgi:hypothetical protein
MLAVAASTALAASLGIAGPAAASTPACTVAAAPLLDLGVANAFTTTNKECFGPNTDARGVAYSVVDIPAWGTLTVDVDARNILNYLTSIGNDFRMGVFQPGTTDYTLPKWSDAPLGTDGLSCKGEGDAGTMFRLTCTPPLAGRYVIRWENSGNAIITPTVTPLVPTVTAKAYRKKSRLDADVDPNLGIEYRVQLQKRAKNGQWVNASGVKPTTKTHRKFNPKKGTYRVVVFGPDGAPANISNEVRLKR